MSTVQSTAPPNLTIISHTDNEHAQADEILAAIELAVKGVELFAPLIISLIHSSGSTTISVPATSTSVITEKEKETK